MPHFDIVKKSEIEKTYRVARIMSDFDVKTDHADEHFVGEINIPFIWNIGVIVGASGTGKTTIAKQLFENQYIKEYLYTSKSVIDDMPQTATVDEIERIFYAVGFGSVPSWMKPYSVLSNGEKMRVDLARALLSNDLIVFDEFTSVVDRNVAQTTCIAINRAIKKADKQFVAVTCHRDVLEWWQPDWIFDTDTMTNFFQSARVEKNNLQFENAGEKTGKSFGVITI